MRLGETLQFLGVIDPQIRHRARSQAVLECAPQLVNLLRDVRPEGATRPLTELEQSDVDAKFKKIVDARTDEIMRALIVAQRSG